MLVVTPLLMPSMMCSLLVAVNTNPFSNIKKLAVKGGAVVDPDSGNYMSSSSLDDVLTSLDVQKFGN